MPPTITTAPFDVHDTLFILLGYFLAMIARALSYFTTLLIAAPAPLPHGNLITNTSAPYLLGLGIGDITGPVVETNMMGYAYLPQTDTGLHMRQRSRAFIIADATAPNDRILFINADIGLGDSHIRRAILARLGTMYGGLGENHSTALYTASNTAFAATHAHAGVGGYTENLLPQLTSFGYVPQTAEAIITGTVRAVQRAHEAIRPGSLSVGNVIVRGGNVNRSPTAYEANPEEERRYYDSKGDTDNPGYNNGDNNGYTDKDMTVIRFDDTDAAARGFLSFYPVHGTSLYENNTLISGDNKGMAAYLYESAMNPQSMPGNTSFVAGFVQSNVGDVSPNTLGAFCESPGKPWHDQPCDREHSTCGGKVQDCHGRGPGFRISDFESNRIIAQVQVDAARNVMEMESMSGSGADDTENKKRKKVRGRVRSVHVYLNMAHYTFSLPNGTRVQTCPAALGYAFAGGTTDGPGAFDFVQGDNSSTPRRNPFWELVKGAVTPLPTAEQKACQWPKPILLNTGYAHFPYEWSPSTVDVQMLRVGNLVMLIMPGELTTMAGRRIRDAVREKLISSGVLGHDAHVVLAGPANTYAHYVATKEEYAVQRYEGASTIFGRWTLDAYIEKYTSLVPYLADDPSSVGVNRPPHSDPAPEDLTKKAISLQPKVVFDNPPIGKKFGDVTTDVRRNAYHAGEIVIAKFVAGNPRNNLRLEGTFLSVERRIGGQWVMVKTDSHASTRFHWARTNVITGSSEVTVSWTIEDGTPVGTYRLVYYGDAKPLVGKVTSFVGLSSSFTVT